MIAIKLPFASKMIFKEGKRQLGHFLKSKKHVYELLIIPDTIFHLPAPGKACHVFTQRCRQSNSILPSIVYSLPVMQNLFKKGGPCTSVAHLYFVGSFSYLSVYFPAEICNASIDVPEQLVLAAFVPFTGCIYLHFSSMDFL